MSDASMPSTSVDASAPVRCHATTMTRGEPRPCRNWAIPGGRVCRMHGGSLKRTKAAAARRLAVEAVKREAARLGGSLDVDPLDVLLQAVREAAANVAVLRDAIGDLGVTVGHDGAIALPERELEWSRGGGTHVPARVHVLVAMYDAERDRLARYAKLCLDAGVDERRVRVAEQQAQVLGQAIGRALDDGEVALTPAQRQALRAAMARELRALGGA